MGLDGFFGMGIQMVNKGLAQNIHCADTPNGTMRYDHFDIDLWHMAKGYKRQLNARKPPPVPHLLHVGYHAIILCDGTLIDGRGRKEQGANAPGWNHKAWGVCMMGRDKFTNEQWLTLREVVMDWKRAGAQTILGHRQINRKKKCPGFSVQAWIDGGMKPLAGHIVTA